MWMRSVVVGVLLLAFLAAFPVEAASKSFELQRRVGVDGKWVSTMTFILSRHSPTSPVKLKQSIPEATELSTEQKKQLMTVDHLSYRVLPAGEGGEAMDQPPLLTVSPCTLVRGFIPEDGTTMTLPESFLLAVGYHFNVTGLQLTSYTNAYHAKLSPEVLCERKVLSIFKKVLLQPSLKLLTPTVPHTVADYDELVALEANAEEKPDGKRQRASPARPTKPRPDGDAGSEDALEVEVQDERSFLEKYWMYFVLPIAFNGVRAMMERFAPAQTGQRSGGGQAAE